MLFSIKDFKTQGSILLKSEIARLFPVFYDRLHFPRYLATIIITHRCNLRCIMCKQWRQHVDKELNTEDWKSVLIQLRELFITDVHFTGGEPLLRKDLCELVRHAAGLKCRIGITTNGQLLSEAFLEELVVSGVTSIAISLDALNNEYENIRGLEGSYEKAEGALRLLSQYRKGKKIKGYINFTLMKPSLPHFYDVKKMADSLGLPVAICLLDGRPYFFDLAENREQFWLGDECREELNCFLKFLQKEKRKNPDSLIISRSGIRYIDNYFRDSLQKRIPCIASGVRIFVDPYGKFMGGCLSGGNLGSLKHSSLKEILGNGRLRPLQKDMFYKKCPGCSCGYLYNLERHLPSLLTDIIGFRYV